VSHYAFRYSLIAASLAFCGNAAAIGLGELRGAPALGERPQLEVAIIGGEKAGLDPACFRLKQPAGDRDMPWLKQGTLSIRRGQPPVLLISSHLPLNDPALGIAVEIGCGYDVVREYVLLASPPSGKALAYMEPAPRASTPAAPRRTEAPARVAAPKPAVAGVSAETAAPGSKPAAEPPKAAVLAAPAVPGDAAGASEEKIKSMESQVGALQQRAAELTQKIEQAAVQAPEAKLAAPSAAVAAAPAPAPARSDAGGSNWALYSALIAAALAIAGWLGWRNRRASESSGETQIPVDPQRKGEREERGGVDLDVEPEAMARPVRLDPAAVAAAAPATTKGPQPDSTMSIMAATVDEHFESNPVMELAEIMLSFGRVKGAAQALQEYIDTNPQEALKPWIRLMDVYRMAGMRHEFEKVANELNKNFNVQVQKWEDFAEGQDHTRVDVVLEAKPSVQPAGMPGGVEEMPAIMEKIIQRWQSDEVLGYMNQLLRDNRGGTRIGFALPVVSDLLFLVELKEVANKIDSEGEAE
jgi:pilus assembly protein FimV